MSATSDSIRERAIGLLSRYRLDTNDSDLNIDSLITWLNERVTVHGIGLTTAKIYRRWLAAYFESENHPSASKVRNWVPPGSQEAAVIADELDAQKVMMVESVANNSRYLSYIDARALDALFEDLTKRSGADTPRYSSGFSAAMFFTATLMTGLRPAEWQSARYREAYFDPDTKLTLGPVLEVQTLKQDKRRDDNPLRENRLLLLDQMPDHQLQHIRTFLAEVKAQGDRFPEYIDRVRKILSRSWKRVMAQQPDLIFDTGIKPPKGSKAKSAAKAPTLGVSLYTARHIFAEEIRRSQQFTRFELAAMLGHTLLTNQIYYGPRDAHRERGHKFALPRAWPGDADEIAHWDHKVNPMRFKYTQGDLFGGDLEQAPAKDHAADFVMG